jgi:hypothetical protein
MIWFLVQADCLRRTIWHLVGPVDVAAGCYTVASVALKLAAINSRALRSVFRLTWDWVFPGLAGAGASNVEVLRAVVLVAAAAAVGLVVCGVVTQAETAETSWARGELTTMTRSTSLLACAAALSQERGVIELLAHRGTSSAGGGPTR